MSARSADSGAKSSTRKSNSSYNSTSTYVYASSSYKHESFETFQTKVLALTHTLFDAREVELQRKKGGSYNRVVAVRVTTASGKLAGIFRIPRGLQVPEDEEEKRPAANADIHDQAAVLQLLESKQIPAPALVAFDVSADNAINSPYVLLELATGAPLENAYGDMNLQEKTQIADSLVDFLTRMEKVQFSKCGVVMAASRGSSTVLTKASRISGTIDKLATTVRGYDTAGVFAFESTKEVSATTSALELLRDLLQAHRDLAVSLWGRESQEKWGEDIDVALWKGLQTMLEDMCDLGFFTDLEETSHQGSILYHWDLEPRNILVKRVDAESRPLSTTEQIIGPSSSRWVIDKVIDWDKVQAVPPILARKPPVWLWDPNHDQYCSKPGNYKEHTYDGDVDLLPASRHEHGQNTFSSDDEALRAQFEKSFVRAMRKVYPQYNLDTYKDEAYGRGRWIRRVARFALESVWDGEHFKRFERLKQKWAEGRLQYVQAKLGDLSL